MEALPACYTVRFGPTPSSPRSVKGFDASREFKTLREAEDHARSYLGRFRNRHCTAAITRHEVVAVIGSAP